MEYIVKTCGEYLDSDLGHFGYKLVPDPADALRFATIADAERTAEMSECGQNEGGYEILPFAK